MKFFVFIILLSSIMSNDIIFNFTKSADISDWVVVVDGVMGGKSTGEFCLTEEGNALFKGHISLENNGGFSSVRYRFPKMDVSDHSQIHLRAKGDGKKYQFRIKDHVRNYYSYTSHFDTSGEWEDITIDLKYMYPVFRGRILNLPDFSADDIAEVTILIGNKAEESFRLEIDSIYLE